MSYPTYMPQYGNVQYQPYMNQRIEPQMYMPQNAAQSAAGPVQGMGAMPSAAGVQTGFMCRPVTSRAEAVASQIPFDGSTTYFVDTSNGSIYAKTFNLSDGTAPIVTYVREVEATIQYATIDDINALRAEIDALRKPGKAAKKNDADE